MILAALASDSLRLCPLAMNILRPFSLAMAVMREHHPNFAPPHPALLHWMPMDLKEGGPAVNLHTILVLSAHMKLYHHIYESNPITILALQLLTNCRHSPFISPPHTPYLCSPQVMWSM